MLQRKTTFKTQNRKRFKINLNKNNLYKNRIYIQQKMTFLSVLKNLINL
jgi:hypothetical protein